VGTAHFSKESCEDVCKTVQLTQPDFVMVFLFSFKIKKIFFKRLNFALPVFKYSQWMRIHCWKKQRL